MAAAATVAALLSLFKRLYVGKDLSNMALRKSPFWRTVRKVDDLVGEGIYIPYNYGLPVGYSANFANAQANVRASKVARWFLERNEYSGFHTIKSEAIYASRGKEAAFLSVKEKELNEVVKGMGQEFAVHMWGDGSGVIGRLGDTTTGATPTSTLTDPRDAVKLHIGQVLVANDTADATSIRTDVYEITDINRSTGAITFTRTSGSADDWAANDYIFVQGNQGAMFSGVQAWIPSTDPSDTFMGMDRSDDPVMKGGWRGSWLGSIEESALDLCANMGTYFNEAASGLWLNRYNWFRLERELKAKNSLIYDDQASGYFGVKAISLNTPEGSLPVMADPFCPSDTGFLLDHDSWEIHHMEGLPHMVTEDGLSSLRLSDEHGIEVRFRAWMEGLCFRPFTNGRFPIS